MSTLLAWSNLVYQPSRTVVAIAGIAFAIVMVFMQLGFLASASATATLFSDQLVFDIALTSAQYVDLSQPHTFPRTALPRAESVAGVERAVPLYLGFQMWRTTPTADPGFSLWRTSPPPDRPVVKRRSIMIAAFPPTDPVFRLPDVRAAAGELKRPDTVLIDRRTRPEFGPQAVGTRNELGGHGVTIQGQFTLGTGFASDGLLLTSDETYARLFPMRSRDNVSLGLVQLRPGASPAEVSATAARLREVMPAGVRVRTRDEFDERSRNFWVQQTSVGVIFMFGVGVGLLVGAIFVYQVISSDIVNHLAEYATIKAMGYGETFVSAVVMQQAVFLAVMGYVPGVCVSLGLYQLTRESTGLPIGMTPERAALVLAASVLMCCASGFCALGKVRSANPAELFR